MNLPAVTPSQRARWAGNFAAGLTSALGSTVARKRGHTEQDGKTLTLPASLAVSLLAVLSGHGVRALLRKVWP